MDNKFLFPSIMLGVGILVGLVFSFIFMGKGVSPANINTPSNIVENQVQVSSGGDSVGLAGTIPEEILVLNDFSIVEDLDQEQSVLTQIAGEIVKNKDALYAVEMPKDFSSDAFYQGYLDWFKLIKQDSIYFQATEKVDEELFFQIWSDYLFGTDYTGGSYDALYACIAGEGDAENIEDEFSRKICEGTAIEEDENYRELKESFIEYKKLITGERNTANTLTEYIILEAQKEEYTETEFMNDYFYYLIAGVQGNCSSLKKPSLQKICE